MYIPKTFNELKKFAACQQFRQNVLLSDEQYDDLCRGVMNGSIASVVAKPGEELVLTRYSNVYGTGKLIDQVLPGTGTTSAVNPANVLSIRLSPQGIGWSYTPAYLAAQAAARSSYSSSGSDYGGSSGNNNNNNNNNNN